MVRMIEWSGEIIQTTEERDQWKQRNYWTNFLMKQIIESSETESDTDEGIEREEDTVTTANPKLYAQYAQVLYPALAQRQGTPRYSKPCFWN